MSFPKKIDQLLFCDQQVLGCNVIFHIHKVAGSESLNETLHMLFDDENLNEGTSKTPDSITKFLVGCKYQTNTGGRLS